ncbi:hypothetical protein MMC06_001980 [Schaereria dolodes]|nr:hypothetical protein [Schaereria dolodes]
MPSKIHEREKGRDRDGANTRDKPRHKSSRSKRKSSSRDGDKMSSVPERSSTIASASNKRRSSMPVPELKRRASSTSPHGSKQSLPYPSFSKAHSKEAVGSREDVISQKPNVYTPDPTDIQGKKNSEVEEDKPTAVPAAPRYGPPSPPLTAVDQVVNDDRGRFDLGRAAEEMRKKLGVRKSSHDGKIPRVDYLMQNGGLSQCVPKSFLAAGLPMKVMQSSTNLPAIFPPTAVQVERFFAPFNGLLDDYEKVMSKSGSLAVATGYRSIARRLLDRLEAVFARDISSEICGCVMCQSRVVGASDLEDERGISWGEILEYVCGRQELPLWPAFALDTAPVGLGISATENRLPMQKLDIDVPEEYRDHYVSQSKKTKQSVDRWLANQNDKPTSPPEEIDDDTLTFAMLTHLEPEQRPILTSLLGVGPSRPSSRAATPFKDKRSDLLVKTGLAIQRLYRLAIPPRDPECAIYLLNNNSLHNVLATLAAVSDGEWEILTSGRFDGFLRSGAEDIGGTTASRGPSRGPTPVGRLSRGPTPLPRSSTPLASVGAPVAMDEETEIAVLAEIEREIYMGMEALEDAFEALHCKAEIVRSSLRERGAGLSMASQARRGGDALEARLGTPASGIGGTCESETDDGIDDGMSELAPDDSASNISSSRHRRPKRRTERRTPALVEEEEEHASVAGVARADG